MIASVAVVAAWGVVLAIGSLAVVHWIHCHHLDRHREAVHTAARELEGLRAELKNHRGPELVATKQRRPVRDVAAASPDTHTDAIPLDALARAGAATGRFEVGDRYGVPRLGPGTELCISIDQGYPCAREHQHDPPHLDVDSNGRITHVWTDQAAAAVSER